MKTVITKITCDWCGVEIPTGPHGLIKAHKGEPVDLCKPCLVKLHDEVQDQYQRVVNGMVRDRRGGYRKLGDYDT